MPLEQASNISQLDDQWPNGTDSVDRGDDHIRLLKSVLKKQFPGPGGNGFSTPLTVDPSVLNSIAQTLKEMSDKIVNVHSVGSVIFRDDATDPGTIYPGTTWTLLSGDSAIALATQQNVGSTIGTNDPGVPLQSHSHGVSLSGNFNHQHYVFTGAANQYGTPLASSPNARPAATGIKRSFTDRDDYMIMESAGGGNCGLTENAAIAVNLSGSTAAAGTAGPTLNVRGQRRLICAWKRVR